MDLVFLFFKVGGGRVVPTLYPSSAVLYNKQRDLYYTSDDRINTCLLSGPEIEGVNFCEFYRCRFNKCYIVQTPSLTGQVVCLFGNNPNKCKTMSILLLLSGSANIRRLCSNGLFLKPNIILKASVHDGILNNKEMDKVVLEQLASIDMTFLSPVIVNRNYKFDIFNDEGEVVKSVNARTMVSDVVISPVLGQSVLNDIIFDVNSNA